MELGNNMLEEEVGEVISASYISSQSIATRLQYGYATIGLLDNLFNVSVSDMRYDSVDLSKLSTDIQYKETIDAIKDSFLFKVVTVSDATAMLNIKRGLLPKKVHLNIDNYIQKFCNKHFKYRRMQLDCEYILQAISSELCIFSESNNINVDFSYDSTINLRATTKQKSSLILNEITALKRIKSEFAKFYSSMIELLYSLECKAYKLCNKPIVNNIDCIIDL